MQAVENNKWTDMHIYIHNKSYQRTDLNAFDILLVKYKYIDNKLDMLPTPKPTGSVVFLYTDLWHLRAADQEVDSVKRDWLVCGL